MQRTRREFIRLSATGAALAVAGTGTGHAEPASSSHGASKAAPALEPAFEAPGGRLTLAPWPYGNSSVAHDTVLMFRGNPGRTFYGTGPLPDRPRQHWKYRMGDFDTSLRGKPKVWSGTGWTGTAAKLGNYVFVGSVGRNLYAFEAGSGRLMWRLRGERMFKSSVCIYDNKLYIGNADDKLRCIDAATGKSVWTVDTRRDLDSSPCVVDDRLYIAGENGYARCFDPHTGKELWKALLGGIDKDSLGGSNGSETSPAVEGGELYAATYDGDLVCVRTTDGSEKWRSRTDADTDASPVVSGDFVYAAAEEESPHLYCFARDDGREVWRYADNALGYWSTPAVAGGRVFVGGDDRNVHCVDARTGKAIWKFQTGAAVWSSPAVVDNKVVVGSMDRKLYILDADSGRELWSQTLDGRILSSPCVVDGHIWIGTATGWFYCLGP